jgi:hypothetical protein
VVLAPPEPPRILGSQEPTHRTFTPYETTLAPQVIGLAEMVGVELDEWQKAFLADGLGMIDSVDATGRPMKKWASYEVGLELSRQNGKSVVFELRCLAGLYLFREREIVYSAHKGETAAKAYARISDLIRCSPELLREVKRFSQTNGKEFLELWTGQILRFRTRTAGGGRGLAGDCVILDESQDLVDEEVAALMPVVSAMPNAQLWYGGSAGTKKSTIQGRLVRRAKAGRLLDKADSRITTIESTRRLTYWRWAIDDDMDPDSPTTWARLNPAVGHRMTIETIESENDAMSPDMFGHERLGRGDYPREEGEDWVIPRTAVERAADPPPTTLVGPVLFGLEVKYDRSKASICVAGRRSDGRRHIELIKNGDGTNWSVPELTRLTGEHKNLGVVIDPSSPASNLVGPLEDAGITVHLMKSAELAPAFSDMYDAMVPPPDDPTWRPQYLHTGGSLLVAHFAEAQVRTSHGALTWRRITQSDTSGVLGCCWAAYKFDELASPPAPPPSPRRADTDGRATRSHGADIAHVGF